ncbi:hypothetical protein D9M69_607340 [compost metagenome]
MTGHEHDRDLGSRCSQLSLKLNAAKTRQPHIQKKTSGSFRIRTVIEIRRIRKGVRIDTDCLEKIDQ